MKLCTEFLILKYIFFSQNSTRKVQLSQMDLMIQTENVLIQSSIKNTSTDIGMSTTSCTIRVYILLCLRKICACLVAILAIA